MQSNWFTIEVVGKADGQPTAPTIYALAEFHHWEKVVSYLIVDKTQAFLIDTGMGYESMREAVAELTSLPVTVLLTHAHWDHIGSAHEFNKVGIFDHAFEKGLLSAGVQSAQVPELSDAAMFDAPFSTREFVAPGTKKFFQFGDGETFVSDSFEINVIHTPGHTPGSVSFHIPQLGILAAGDTLYPGPLYAQMPESNVVDYAASLKKLAKLPSDTVILTGHNKTQGTMKLVAESVQLFDGILSQDPASWPGEAKGKLLSILLPAVEK